jgi:uncharacterized protein YcbX
VTPPPARVEALFRYPVKSLLGETLDSLVVDRRGVLGDRAYAVLDADGKLGSGKSSLRFRRMDGLLGFAARYDGDVALVRLPGGGEVPALDPLCARELSAVVGRPVSVGAEDAVPHLDGSPVHLLSAGALRWVRDRAPESAIDRRRFRPNLVLDLDEPGPAEHGWVGREVEIGNVVLHVEERTPRCVMVTMEQDGLPDDPRVLRALSTGDGVGCLGVGALVVRGGTIRVGDPVRLR